MLNKCEFSSAYSETIAYKYVIVALDITVFLTELVGSI